MTRDEAINRLHNIMGFDYHYLPADDAEAMDMAIEALKQPERKKGKWLITGTFDGFLKCSCCKYMKPWNEDVFNFCPHCGAKMEG